MSTKLTKCLEVVNGFIEADPVYVEFTRSGGMVYASGEGFDSVDVTIDGNVMSITHDDGNVVLVKR